MNIFERLARWAENAPDVPVQERPIKDQLDLEGGARWTLRHGMTGGATYPYIRLVLSERGGSLTRNETGIMSLRPFSLLGKVNLPNDPDTRFDWAEVELVENVRGI